MIEQNAPPRLRPMTLGDMFDAAFRLYRRYFFTFIGVAALLQMPIAIAQMALQFTIGGNFLTEWMRAVTTPALPGSNPFSALPFGQLAMYMGFTFALSIVQVLLVQSLINGALANAVSRAYTGQPISILDAYRIGWRRFFALVGAAMVPLLASTVLFGVLAGCVAGSFFFLLRGGDTNSSALAGALIAIVIFGAFIVGGLVALFLYVRLCLTTQAIVLENQGPLTGIARSWRLTSGAFWRALGLIVLLFLLAYVISAIPTSMVSFALQLISAGDLTALMRNQAIVSGIAVLGQILVLPFQLVIYTMLYYDLRMRKEGYDLELMAQQATL